MGDVVAEEQPRYQGLPEERASCEVTDLFIS